MKKYIFKGKNGLRDLKFTIEDLVPMQAKKERSFEELARCINYSQYYPCETPMGSEYEKLYAKEGNGGVDFFRVKGTTVIVIPGHSIQPTILLENEL